MAVGVKAGFLRIREMGVVGALLLVLRLSQKQVHGPAGSVLEKSSQSCRALLAVLSAHSGHSHSSAP